MEIKIGDTVQVRPSLRSKNPITATVIDTHTDRHGFQYVRYEYPWFGRLVKAWDPVSRIVN